jgi:SpoVK/Ycf46/Vps4 family AAA+-type ATPase
MSPNQPTHKIEFQTAADGPGVTQVVKPGITLEQLKLRQDATLRLKNICQEFKSCQSRMCLFVGQRGNGQELAAQAIAGQLGLPLYRIDLAAIVSKYISETEKNLNRVFDAAANQDAVLFFDEADALFGKRTEVKDSHDRYASLDTNYLLQRMETYEGIVILSSNIEPAPDDARLRCVHHVIKFPA